MPFLDMKTVLPSAGSFLTWHKHVGGLRAHRIYLLIKHGLRSGWARRRTARVAADTRYRQSFVPMKIFGIAGHSGMGKTTLLERLIPEIALRGMVVSLIKHSHKDIDIDRPGKDSYRLRESGCKEVLLLGSERWALMHELRGATEPELEQLLPRMQLCDLVLIEGFKAGGFPKLEVWRVAVAKPPLWPDMPDIVAIASDTPTPSSCLPRFDLSDVKSIAEFVLANASTMACVPTDCNQP